MLRQAQHERNINRLHRSPWACRRVMLTFYETIIIVKTLEIFPFVLSPSAHRSPWGSRRDERFAQHRRFGSPFALSLSKGRRFAQHRRFYPPFVLSLSKGRRFAQHRPCRSMNGLITYPRPFDRLTAQGERFLLNWTALGLDEISRIICLLNYGLLSKKSNSRT